MSLRKTLGGAEQTIEMAAQATVDPAAEDWRQAQAELYAALRQQPANAPPEHYCQQHRTPFNRFQRDGRTWYSHRLGNSGWCREK